MDAQLSLAAPSVDVSIATATGLAGRITIALWGPKGAGKSTVADLLSERHWFTQLSFAGPLKGLVGHLFGWGDEILSGPSSERDRPEPRASSGRYWDGVYERLHDAGADLARLFAGSPMPVSATDATVELWFVVRQLQRQLPLTPRVALQQVGTEWGRSLWSEVWVQAAGRSLDGLRELRVVFADCRYANEADAIHARGGTVVWVDPGERVQRDALSDHASESTYEQASPYVDRVISTAGPIDLLPAVVDGLVESIRLGRAA